MPEPDWLAKARAEGRITEGRSAGEALGLNPVNAGLGPPENKYRNQPVTVQGLGFDSIKEAKRWVYLCDLVKLGAIKNLRRQVRYDLVVNGKKISWYTADFVYETLGGETVVEDVKSEATAQERSYGIRKRLMAALYGVEIQEV